MPAAPASPPLWVPAAGSLPPSLAAPAGQPPAVPPPNRLPPPAGPFRASSPPSRPAPRGSRCSARHRPSPAPVPWAPLGPAPRAGSVPTSGYRLQPPRLWHYGHGGGDGSAEAEQAGHQGAGTVCAPFLRGGSRRRAAPRLEVGGPREEVGPGRGPGPGGRACSSGAAAPGSGCAAAARAACGAPFGGWA